MGDKRYTRQKKKGTWDVERANGGKGEGCEDDGRKNDEEGAPEERAP